jgi:DNA-binding NarL/FixJ family response regulator
MALPRVLLVDDHALLLAAFEELLGNECTIVGHATDGRAAVTAAEALKPDIVVLDIAMPLQNGLDSARQIKRKQRHVKLVFVTMYEDPELVAEAFRAGASAYLVKRSAASELSRAIHEVMEGRSYVTPLVMQPFVGSLLEPGQHRLKKLSPRQRDVLRLLAEGHSMKDVAARLGIEPRTVAFHKYQMMQQLDVKTSAELIQYAVRHHIV